MLPYLKALLHKRIAVSTGTGPPEGRVKPQNSQAGVRPRPKAKKRFPWSCPSPVTRKLQEETRGPVDLLQCPVHHSQLPSPRGVSF